MQIIVLNLHVLFLFAVCPRIAALPLSRTSTHPMLLMQHMANSDAITNYFLNSEVIGDGIIASHFHEPCAGPQYDTAKDGQRLRVGERAFLSTWKPCAGARWTKPLTTPCSIAAMCNAPRSALWQHCHAQFRNPWHTERPRPIAVSHFWISETNKTSHL